MLLDAAKGRRSRLVRFQLREICLHNCGILDSKLSVVQHSDICNSSRKPTLGLLPNVHAHALLPIGYPMGRFGPVRRLALLDVLYQDQNSGGC